MKEQLCVLRIFFSKLKIAHEDSFGKITSSFDKMQGKQLEFYS